MRRGKSATGTRELIALQVGDDARWAHLRVDRYLMCGFFFTALQGLCFFSGAAGSFLCPLFFMFFFPLFLDCSFGAFFAALVGPRQFWRDIGFFVLHCFGRRAGRNRLEFAREGRHASEAARFDRVLVMSVSFKSCHHDGDRPAFIPRGQPTFRALAPPLTWAIQTDRPHGFKGLWIDLGFDRLLAGVLAARLDGPEDGCRGVRNGRERESSSDARSDQRYATGAIAPSSRMGTVRLHSPRFGIIVQRRPKRFGHTRRTHTAGRGSASSWQAACIVSGTASGGSISRPLSPAPPSARGLRTEKFRPLNWARPSRLALPASKQASRLALARRPPRDEYGVSRHRSGVASASGADRKSRRDAGFEEPSPLAHTAPAAALRGDGQDDRGATAWCPWRTSGEHLTGKRAERPGRHGDP
jgi:hypothetical protein